MTDASPKSHFLRGIWWSKHPAFIQGWSHIFRQTPRYRLNQQELTSDPREWIWATEMEFSQHKYTKITKCTQKKNWCSQLGWRFHPWKMGRHHWYPPIETHKSGWVKIVETLNPWWLSTLLLNSCWMDVHPLKYGGIGFDPSPKLKLQQMNLSQQRLVNLILTPSQPSRSHCVLVLLNHWNFESIWINLDPLKIEYSYANKWFVILIITQ